MENNNEAYEPVISSIIYISNIPKKVDKQLLHRLLEPYGPIISLNIIHRGEFAFAFAEFDDMRDAAIAVKELNQTLYQNRKLKVEFKNKKKNSSPTNPESDEKMRFNIDRPHPEQKQVCTEVSLGQQANLQKKQSQCFSEKCHRQRSRQKNRDKRFTNDLKQNKKPSQQSGRHSETDKTKKVKRQKYQQKMIELPESDMEDLAEQLLFIESRLSKIYDKMDRMMCHGQKLKEILRK